MDSLGINSGFLLIQLLNFSLLLGWLLLSLFAILNLRKQNLPPIAQALWVLIVLGIPLVGAIVYWLVRPSNGQRNE